MSEDAECVGRIAALVVERELTVATAESLTSGTIAKTLGAGPNASAWFRGGVVAYAEDVKFHVLGVDEGPVVTDRCAQQMAEGARRLLDADLVVAATGVGGPDPSEGEPPGTVFVAVAGPSGVETAKLSLDGDPDAVLAGTVSACLVRLANYVLRT